LAWSIVGCGKLVGLLRKPLVRPVADKAYLIFAKHRYNISLLLTGKRRLKHSECLDGSSEAKLR
ncbi:DUF393 domain-containing protein, partial [Motilimonas sp. KMU-193]